MTIHLDRSFSSLLIFLLVFCLLHHFCWYVLFSQHLFRRCSGIKSSIEKFKRFSSILNSKATGGRKKTAFCARYFYFQVFFFFSLFTPTDEASQKSFLICFPLKVVRSIQRRRRQRKPPVERKTQSVVRSVAASTVVPSLLYYFSFLFFFLIKTNL